jgi:serine phosphatase RsbU (regulator of sigma subunit)
LYELQILDTPIEEDFEDLTRVVSQILGTPIALVSLIDKDRQWFKSKIGLEESETPREIAFCSHAILNPEEVLVVPDAKKDDRFIGNPLVMNHPGIRFYMGAPLISQNGFPIGTLCAIDTKPREVSDEKVQALKILARQTMAQIELRALNRKLKREHDELVKSQAKFKEFHSRISRDLSLATQIQNGLIPKVFPTSPYFKIESRYVPMEEVGGDAIGFYSHRNRNAYSIFFGDVSGHGIASALISAMSLMVFNLVAEKDLSPALSLKQIHENMISVHSNLQFISGCYLKFFPDEKRLEYSYAGHYPILVIRKGEVLELAGRGSLLLIKSPADRQNYEFQLESGDKLILVSDGFFDVFNENMEQLGWERLKTWLLESASTCQSDCLDKIVDRVKLFSDEKRSDDMTILAIDIF